MNAISPKCRAAQLIAQLDQLRREVKELKAFPPPRPDILAAFRNALRSPMDEVETEPTSCQPNPI